MKVLEARKGAVANHSSCRERAVLDDVPENLDEVLVTQGVDLRHGEGDALLCHDAGGVCCTTNRLSSSTSN